jgi:hypothetical protein
MRRQRKESQDKYGRKRKRPAACPRQFRNAIPVLLLRDPRDASQPEFLETPSVQ